jgi:cell division septation protein DedD
LHPLSSTSTTRNCALLDLNFKGSTMITIPGQLAIRTIHGRNGDFNVGRLATSVGEFVVKNPELDQYAEGKYEGEFSIAEFRPSMYSSGGRMVIELRALLGGMTLSDIDELSKDDAQRMTPQEVDPADEESQPAAAAATPAVAAPEPSSDPLVDTTPFGVKAASKSSPSPRAEDKQDPDVALFGTLWPLGPVVKLDATVDRRVLRQQCARLDKLGYDFEPLSQEWHLKAAA